MPHPTRSPRARRFTAGVGLPIALTLLLAGSAAPAAAGDLEVHATITAKPSIVGLSGAGWKLQLHADGVLSNSVSLKVVKPNGTGAARAFLETVAYQTRTTCDDATLTSCRISDDGSLGLYGEVDLIFVATKARKVANLTCPGSGLVHTQRYTRKGQLQGVLRLETRNRYLKTIRNGEGPQRVPQFFAATVTRDVATGADCPAPPVCQAGVLFGSVEPNLLVRRRLPTGPARAEFAEDLASLEPDVARRTGVTWSETGAEVMALTVKTLATATIHADRAAPFLTGTSIFTATSAIDTITDGGCDLRTRLGQIDHDLVLDLPWAPPTARDLTDSAKIWRTLP